MMVAPPAAPRSGSRCRTLGRRGTLRKIPIELPGRDDASAADAEHALDCLDAGVGPPRGGSRRPRFNAGRNDRMAEQLEPAGEVEAPRRVGEAADRRADERRGGKEWVSTW